LFPLATRKEGSAETLDLKKSFSGKKMFSKSLLPIAFVLAAAGTFGKNSKLFLRLHDTQHNGTQHNNTQHNVPHHNPLTCSTGYK
jgi:hypothetical protein